MANGMVPSVNVVILYTSNLQMNRRNSLLRLTARVCIFTMSEATAWRRGMVRPVLEAYAGVAGVDAVMMCGSTARGDADRWSDVEVAVFWGRPPGVDARTAIAGAAEVRMVGPWSDHVYLGAPRPDGLLVEVMHNLSATLEDLLEGLMAGSADGATLDLVSGIVEGREIVGRRVELVAEWQRRVQAYPRALAIAVVRHQGAIEQFWRWRMLVERDNPLLLAREFMRICSQFLSVLQALNGRYCGHASAFKRLDSMERQLTIAPPHLAARLRSVFQLPTAEGAEVLRTLVEETYDLVEAELPEVEVDVLRANFRSERRPLDAPPA
ncbi:hypothetical protein ACXJJ3_41560 [Kribbella sp. WER1]